MCGSEQIKGGHGRMHDFMKSELFVAEARTLSGGD